ncbi:hypothetical protein P3T76_013479 [Phytophthora citrophthora]|uniref:Uncharacterized protein n=1 Tax=Phytophthora citrophthora TaxID=4793 RepID=A0AAD9LC21_9STRA|nr:hypothetical protein P3T76_013479 [Phytophthora citrophthora]
MQFDLMSWTLEDYKAAMADDEFFEHVKTKFTSTDESVPPEEREQLLEEKFYVAGGSARYMFDFSLSEVAASLDKAIAAVEDIKKYFTDTRGASSEGVINRLFSWYRVEQTGKAVSRLVSKYVAKEIAEKLGPDYVQNIANSLTSTPVFELWFFAKLSHGGVWTKKKDQNLEIISHDTWKADNGVPFFDPKHSIPVNQGQQWLAPRKWNQGGYDAMYVEMFDGAGKPTVQVRFVQASRGDKHSFVHEFFVTLLHKLTDSFQGYQFKSVEVYFAIPISKLRVFDPKVDALQVRRHVLEPAGLPETTRNVIEIVGLDYKEFRESDHPMREQTKRPNTSL